MKPGENFSIEPYRVSIEIAEGYLAKATRAAMADICGDAEHPGQADLLALYCASVALKSSLERCLLALDFTKPFLDFARTRTLMGVAGNALIWINTSEEVSDG